MSRNYITCPACYHNVHITKADLSFEELECGNCDFPIHVPNTLEEVEGFNKQIAEERYKRHYTGNYRVMVTGEDGTEFCVKNGVPEDLIDLVVDGVRVRYPEARQVVAEPEAAFMFIDLNELG